MSTPVPLLETQVPPVRLLSTGPHSWFVDFGRVVFGTLEIELECPSDGHEVVFHLGEKAAGPAALDRTPPGTVRYRRAPLRLERGRHRHRLAIPPDARNTGPAAVPMPPSTGEVLPFRYVEIENAPGPMSPQDLRQVFVHAPFNDDAADFECSDPVLNRAWHLCKHTIKATTFCGIYVDGDRERIPYEADAYINQLAHYACDADPRIARATFDWLMRSPTWPSEWAPHMVFMAHADWWQTGDRGWVADRFDALRSKLLDERRGADGLVGSSPEQIKQADIVDWPPGERDGFEFTAVNTVVNAFHLRAHALMAELAAALGREAGVHHHQDILAHSLPAFQAACFRPERGCYADGAETGHVSLHANLFPLAFGLVPPEHRASVLEYLRSRDMACSVYAAHYLMEGLFTHGAADHAFHLATAPGDRSWRHMVESGTTLTWEAWDQRYKPNQDWNHAWGAAPAIFLPRHVLGVQATGPGWKSVRIQPQPGPLTWATGRVPTPHGPITVSWKRPAPDAPPEIECQLPAGVRLEAA